MKAFLTAVCLLLFVPLTAAAQRPIQVTVTSIIDGDTLVAASGNKVEMRIKLDGLEAPEPGQPLFEIAKHHLSELVLNKQAMLVLSSAGTGTGVSGRIYVGGNDIGAQMIRDGAAWFDSSSAVVQSADAANVYKESEKAARAERRGIWQEDSPTSPWQHRQDIARKAAEVQPQPVARKKPTPGASLTSLDVSRVAPSGRAGGSAYDGGSKPTRAGNQSSSDTPTLTEIEDAIRQRKVLLGMNMRDVEKAWGRPRYRDRSVRENMEIAIWGYARSKVYFQDGKVYEVVVLS